MFRIGFWKKNKLGSSIYSKSYCSEKSNNLSVGWPKSVIAVYRATQSIG
jgi:hypothetical protein